MVGPIDLEGQTSIFDQPDTTEPQRDAPARVETIETRSFNGREYRLVRVSAGLEPAGASMRWTDGYYGVRSIVGGAINGRRCTTEAEARRLLDAWEQRAAAELATPCRTCGQPMSEHVGYVCPTPAAVASDPIAPVAIERARPTRRERLKARAERRREWAAARERDGEAARERVHQIADRIPFGQPILVGHHSERGARADQRRMENGRRVAVENWAMAKWHGQKADGIERQLRTSIFSDDADAVARLEAKAAKLEASREAWKAANAAYRREHKAELAAMSAYERSCAVPYPGYHLTNAGAEIRRCRDRIEQIRRDAAVQESGSRGVGRQMLARYSGTCATCGEPIERGAAIVYYRATREAVHEGCADAR